MDTQQSLIERIAAKVVLDVCELPDRTSPDDWPEALLVTGEELHSIIVEAIRSLSSVPVESVHVLADVVSERRRQMEEEGWSAEHDDAHANGDLAVAAACYAAPDRVKWLTADEERQGVPVAYAHVLRWPWSREWWKPKGRRRDLVRATALLVAEIERIDRAAIAGKAAAS